MSNKSFNLAKDSFSLLSKVKFSKMRMRNLRTDDIVGASPKRFRIAKKHGYDCKAQYRNIECEGGYMVPNNKAECSKL